MNVTVLGLEIDITIGTLFFGALAVIAARVVFNKLAPANPAQPQVTDHTVGDRLVAAITVAAAIIAIGTFITSGVTAQATSEKKPSSPTSSETPRGPSATPKPPAATNRSPAR